MENIYSCSEPPRRCAPHVLRGRRTSHRVIEKPPRDDAPRAAWTPKLMPRNPRDGAPHRYLDPPQQQQPRQTNSKPSEAAAAVRSECNSTSAPTRSASTPPQCFPDRFCTVKWWALPSGVNKGPANFGYVPHEGRRGRIPPSVPPAPGRNLVFYRRRLEPPPAVGCAN